MTWQDEQRKLAEEYSRGVISAEEYRTRRDQLLAAANSAPNDPSAETTKTLRPVGPQPPVPPGYEYADHAERTQIVRPVQGPDADADRTQVVSPSAPNAAQPPSGEAGQPYGGQRSPDPAEQDEAPPWSGAEFPPLVAPGSSDWLVQGPEGFDEKPGSNKGKIIAVVVAVVVLVGLALGAYLIWGRGGSSDQAGGSTSAASSVSAQPKPQPEFPLGQLPAGVLIAPAIKSVAQVFDLNPPYLIDAEKQAYQTAGTTDAELATGKLDDGSSVTILLVKAKDAQNAFAAAQQLTAVQISNGRTQDNSVPSGVQAATLDAKDGQNAGIRGHYSHGNVIVRIDVTAPTLAQATQDFNTLLAAEIKAIAPDA